MKTEIDKIVKYFKNFCSTIDGKYCEKVFPTCIKRDFEIELVYLEGTEVIKKLGIQIISKTGDVTSFIIKDITDIKVNKLTELDEKGNMRYYSFVISTNKGKISLKKDLFKNMLVLDFESKDLKYSSTILL